MKTSGVLLLKKLHVLLAVLLCSILAVAMPLTTHGSPVKVTTPAADILSSAQAPNIIFAGELASGEAEAVLQLDKALLLPLVQQLLGHLYPQTFTPEALPVRTSLNRGDNGFHTILTKGP